MKTKLMAMLLAAGAAFGAFGETIDLAMATAATVAQDGDVLTGTLGANVKISISDYATVTLKDVTIYGGDDDSFKSAGITCLGDASIILDGVNVVTGFCCGAGIYIPQNKTLTIQGAGSLDVHGGRNSAGIGGDRYKHCGNIVISGGVVTSVGDSLAAGIGGGYDGSCGDITITDGVIGVTAVKGAGAANSIGVGYGSSLSCGTVTIGGTVGAIAESLYAYCPAADMVVAQIDAIGEVAYTDESKAKIDAARAAYDALAPAQQALVANYATLTAAEAAYAALAPQPPAPEVPDPPVTPETETSETPEIPAPCYVVLDEADVKEPYAAAKAVTLAGAAYDGCDVVGVVELKLGKVNAKKGTSKVSGSVTTLDGKKHTAKGVTVAGVDGTAPVTVSLEVKDLGTMAVTIGGTQFAGSLGAYHVQSADVGGAWAGGSAVAAVEPGDLSVFAGTALAEFLPTNEVAAVSGGKWNFAKAASVKWAKPKGASEKELVVDTSKGKTNLSGLKLSYTPKKGTFKGSFNVYVLEGSGAATKLKKYKLNVSGVVVGGVGYGVATSKKPAFSWPMTVE